MKIQNHFYPNLDLVRIQKTFLKSNIGKTLDFGFGSGENLVFLSNEGHEIYGLETSFSALKITKKKSKDKKLKSNLKILSSYKKIQFQDGFFDNIICLSVFSQLKNKKNFLDILKKNNFKIINHGEIYKSYFNIKDHEF